MNHEGSEVKIKNIPQLTYFRCVSQCMFSAVQVVSGALNCPSDLVVFAFRTAKFFFPGMRIRSDPLSFGPPDPDPLFFGPPGPD